MIRFLRAAQRVGPSAGALAGSGRTAGCALLRLVSAPSFLAQTASPSPAPPRQRVAIGYVEIADPRYEPLRPY
jgi:hypothetical protein